MKIKYKCRFCRTRWEVDSRGDRTGGGGSSGFVSATVIRHVEWCQSATPEERLEYIIRNRKRIEKKPNKTTDVFFDEDFVKQQ